MLSACVEYAKKLGPNGLCLHGMRCHFTIRILVNMWHSADTLKRENEMHMGFAGLCKPLTGKKSVSLIFRCLFFPMRLGSPATISEPHSEIKK